MGNTSIEQFAAQISDRAAEPRLRAALSQVLKRDLSSDASDVKRQTGRAIVYSYRSFAGLLLADPDIDEIVEWAFEKLHISALYRPGADVWENLTTLRRVSADKLRDAEHLGIAFSKQLCDNDGFLNDLLDAARRGERKHWERLLIEAILEGKTKFLGLALAWDLARVATTRGAAALLSRELWAGIGTFYAMPFAVLAVWDVNRATGGFAARIIPALILLSWLHDDRGWK